jgi:hypothetical protein
MSAHAPSAVRPLGIRVGDWLASVLLSVGAFVLMSLAHYPGLIKLAGLIAVAFGMIAAECRRHGADRSLHLVGPAAVAGTGAVALVWPALPGEQVATVAIVAGLAVAHSVNVELVLRRARRGVR